MIQWHNILSQLLLTGINWMAGWDWDIGPYLYSKPAMGINTFILGIQVKSVQYYKFKSTRHKLDKPTSIRYNIVYPHVNQMN